MLQRSELFDHLICDIFIFLLLSTSAVRSINHGGCTVPHLSRHCKARCPAVLFHLFVHGLLQSETQGNHDYDRCGPDHDSEHGQKCPQLPSPKAADAHPQ